MIKYTYLLVNVFTILVPFIFSFHGKIQFYRKWKVLLPAMVVVSFIFIAWDSYFTRLGVWSFNPAYTTGLTLLNLPVEEWLFFLCIPYACVFTWYCLTKFYRLSWNSDAEKLVVSFFCFILLVVAFANIEKLYTSWTFISTALICLFLAFVARVNWIGAAFTVYGILLLPFFIVNGILTGTGLEAPVVMYNDAANLSTRIGTIPIEDVVYGFELFILNLSFFQLNRQPAKEIKVNQRVHPG